MGIKKLIHKAFNIFGIQISKIDKTVSDKNYYIQYPEYIGNNVQIIESQIYGKVIIGEYSMIHKTTILSDCLVQIGRYTSINGIGTEIQSILNPITIGNFCSIARGVTIQENNHDIDRVTTYYIKKHIFKEGIHSDSVSKGAITIGNDVWIGAQSVILSGVTIGNGAVIAANSTVTKDVPPYAIVGGNPAKVIRYRFSDEVVELLTELRWWEWDIDKIIRNKSFFDQKLTIDTFKNIID